MEGYIKLHRQIQTSAVWADQDLLKLWIYCLLKASHNKREVLIDKKLVELKPGQFITGRTSLHAEYNSDVLPRKQIKATTLWSWLKKLESFGNLDIKTTSKYSVVTVVNWDSYQSTLTSEPQQTDSRLTSEPQVADTNKNVKNVKNEKNTVIDADPLDQIANRFAELKTMQSGRESFPKAEDYQLIAQIIAQGVPTSQIIESLVRCFEDYSNRNPKGTISSFRYCIRVIEEDWAAIQAATAAKKTTMAKGDGKSDERASKTNAFSNNTTSEFGALDRIGNAKR